MGGSSDRETTALAVAPAGPEGSDGCDDGDAGRETLHRVPKGFRRHPASSSDRLHREKYDAARVRPLVITAAVTAAIGSAPAAARESPCPRTARPIAGVVFSQRCAGCHTLSAAGTQGSANRNVRVQGPNLDQRKETTDDVLFAIRNGGFSGGIMPANIVTGREANQVATSSPSTRASKPNRRVERRPCSTSGASARTPSRPVRRCAAGAPPSSSTSSCSWTSAAARCCRRSRRDGRAATASPTRSPS
jgi:mono/diheme cytochrome c family protein